MAIDIKVTKQTPGGPIDEEKARECARAVDLIAATVHDQLADLDARTVANALCNVAMHIMVEAGMTHGDVADLFETMAHLSRYAGRSQTHDA